MPRRSPRPVAVLVAVLTTAALVVARPAGRRRRRPSGGAHRAPSRGSVTEAQDALVGRGPDSQSASLALADLRVAYPSLSPAARAARGSAAGPAHRRRRRPRAVRLVGRRGDARVQRQLLRALRHLDRGRAAPGRRRRQRRPRPGHRDPRHARVRARLPHPRPRLPPARDRRHPRRQRAVRRLPLAAGRRRALRLLRARAEGARPAVPLLRLLRARQRLRRVPARPAAEPAGDGGARVLPRDPVRLRRHRGPLVHGGHRDLGRGALRRRHRRQPAVPQARPARPAAQPARRVRRLRAGALRQLGLLRATLPALRRRGRPPGLEPGRRDEGRAGPVLHRRRRQGAPQAGHDLRGVLRTLRGRQPAARAVLRGGLVLPDGARGAHGPPPAAPARRHRAPPPRPPHQRGLPLRAGGARCADAGGCASRSTGPPKAAGTAATLLVESSDGRRQAGRRTAERARRAAPGA